VSFITYQQLSERLHALKMLVVADTLHGAIIGLACAGLSPNDDGWFVQLSESIGGISIDSHDEMLVALYTICVQELADSDCGFQPLIPDGDEFLSVRAKALANWTEAFIAGFAYIKRPLSAEDEDVLRDITAISRLDDDKDYNNPAEANSNEADFMELCEYLRLAVIELYCLVGIERVEATSVKN
jgi:uncharacterized protein YgfB (UPF0149 family)